MATAEFGTRLKLAREQIRWTQQQVADALQVDRKTVDNWEHGRTVPRSSMGAIVAFYASHGVSLDDDGTPGLPPIVADNQHIDQVMVIWNLPDEQMARADRLAWIRAWLKSHPQTPDPVRRRREA